MPGRNGNGDKYRYGFQGQEKDDEIKGEGNSINYKFRMHDPRIGRFFAVDPLAPKYPELTPYQFSSNNTIWYKEIEGLEGAPNWVSKNSVSEELYSNTTTSSSSYQSDMAEGEVLKFVESTITVTYSNDYENMMAFSDPMYSVRVETKTTLYYQSKLTGSYESSTSTKSKETSYSYTDFVSMVPGDIMSSPMNDFSAVVTSNVGNAVNTFSAGASYISRGFSDYGNALINSLYKYEFGNNFWYGTKPFHMVSGSFGLNVTPGVIKRGRTFLNYAKNINKLNVGLSALSIGASIFEYNYNPNYGSGFGGPKGELISDIGVGLLTSKLGFVGIGINFVYAGSIKPVLKASNAYERYEAAGNLSGIGRASGVRDQAIKMEQQKAFKQFIKSSFND